MDKLRKLLAERISNARHLLSMTQSQLAHEAGFSSAQIISQIEKAEREVKAWELFNLAKALRVEASELLAEEFSMPSATVYWRKAPKRNRRLMEADFLKHCSEYALLEQLCEVIINYSLPSRKVDLSSMNFEEARNFGEEVHEQLGLGRRPASSLAGILEERFGIKIWYENLGEEGSAASTKGPFGFAVLINSAEAPWRRNYSFAHELFHFLTWESIAPSVAVEGEFVDNIERLADAFASSLLLPAEEVHEAIQNRIRDDKLSYIDLIEIAREFDVSTVALLWRLRNLGFVGQETVYELLEDPGFKELDRNIRVGSWAWPPEVPERFVRLAFMAYQMGRLSRARLAEFLDTSLIDLTDRLLEYGLDESQDYQTSVRAFRR